MEKIKAYTDLEQSKKLAEFLPIESADMEYMFLKRDGSKVSNMPFVKDDEELEWPNHSTYDFIPCWSLAALLGLIPKFSLEKDVSNNEGYQLHYNYDTTYYDNPVDAAFEMICWLKENNII
jgi:hypothetical protein